MTLRVLLDTSYADRGPSGTGVYLRHLTDALRERGQVEVIEPRPRRRPRPGGGNPFRSALNAALDAAWLHVSLPRAARRAGADVVHHPLAAHSPLIRAAQVTTVLDLTLMRRPQGFGTVWRVLARRRHRRAVRRCGAVVCVSQAVAADAEALLDADPARTVVAPLGPGQELPPRERASHPRHLLYLGDAHERKNLPELLDAYAEYRGGAPEPLDLVLAGAAAALAAGEGVRGEPRPDAGRVADLLAGAAALVHPALEEGFGLTFVEAMAAGTPVVAVRSAAAEEVCGDAALLVEPGGLTPALALIGADPELRAQLSAAGIERARRFDWGDTARMHEEAYTLALDRRSAAGPLP